MVFFLCLSLKVSSQVRTAAELLFLFLICYFSLARSHPLIVQMCFHLAPKSAPSPDVVALSIKIAPTPMPSRAPDSTVVPTASFRTKVPVTHFLSGVSVMEPEASTSVLPRGLNVTSVTQMTAGVTQVAPKRSLDNVLIELDALTKPTWAHEVTVPEATKATWATGTPVVDDRSLGTPYEISPHSFSEGEPPPTQQGPANTGTFSSEFTHHPNLHHHPSTPTSSLYLHHSSV